MLEGARTEIARLVEVKPDDVIFTSGATEANALAILGLPKKGDHVLYLPSAHASIVENAKLLQKRGVMSEPLLIANGQIDIDDLKKRIRPETVLVAVEAVCGEIGTVWNTREVKNAIGKIYLHVDASQAPFTEKIMRAHFGADLLVLDASKVGAMRGIGALIAHRTIPLEPLYRGGGQERGLRPGSESPELAEEFATALRVAVDGRAHFRARAETDRARLVSNITSSIQNVFINEGRNAGLPAGRQAPHILNISLPGRDTDYLVALLDEAGFAVSTRSACETDSEEGSRAVFALTSDKSRALSTIRISWNSDTKAKELDRCVEALIKQVAFVDTDGAR